MPEEDLVKTHNRTRSLSPNHPLTPPPPSFWHSSVLDFKNPIALMPPSSRTGTEFPASSTALVAFAKRLQVHHLNRAMLWQIGQALLPIKSAIHFAANLAIFVAVLFQSYREAGRKRQDVPRQVEHVRKRRSTSLPVGPGKVFIQDCRQSKRTDHRPANFLGKWRTLPPAIRTCCYMLRCARGA